MIKISMDQYYILGNHGVKCDENRIAFDPSTHIQSSLEIYDYASKWLKNISILMKFSINVYFVNLNHVVKFCYGRSIILLGAK